MNLFLYCAENAAVILMSLIVCKIIINQIIESLPQFLRNLFSSRVLKPISSSAALIKQKEVQPSYPVLAIVSAKLDNNVIVDNRDFSFTTVTFPEEHKVVAQELEEDDYFQEVIDPETGAKFYYLNSFENERAAINMDTYRSLHTDYQSANSSEALDYLMSSICVDQAKFQEYFGSYQGVYTADNDDELGHSISGLDIVTRGDNVDYVGLLLAERNSGNVAYNHSHSPN